MVNQIKIAYCLYNTNLGHCILNYDFNEFANSKGLKMDDSFQQTNATEFIFK